MDHEERRSLARDRLEAKRGFQKSLVVYAVVNGFLVFIWFMGDRGSFWPIWPMAAWGLAVLIRWWSVYGRKPISEDDIQREMDKGF